MAVATELYGDLVRVVHAISQLGARALQQHGLTPAQYLVLVRVAQQPNCLQQQLSDHLGVTKGNVSMLVTRLQDAGLLDRVPSGAAYQLRLTPAGRDLVARLRPAHAQFLAAQFDALDKDELAALARALRTLAGRS